MSIEQLEDFIIDNTVLSIVLIASVLGSLVFSGVADPAARPDAAVVDAFKQFDRDASGLLEMREVGPVLSHLGLQADEAVMYEALGICFRYHSGSTRGTDSPNISGNTLS